METATRNLQLDQAVERIAQKDAEQFRQQQIARFKQEQSQRRGEDIKASADTPRQPVENPT